MSIERRKYRRTPIVTEIECSRSGGSFVLLTRDISVGGLFLHTKENFPHETDLQLRFYLDEKTLIEAEGRIVYTVAGLGVGVEFTDLPKSQREALESFIATSVRASGPI
ncbi:MAG: PilZ domain-containing protein [Terriglobia bacterium]